MARQNVALNADERAICRVRYRHVATYIDPGPQARTATDRVVKAIAGHYENGGALKHGPEHSDLLFPFGNPRAVSRHVNKGGPHTESEDREIALAWVETQPEENKSQILALLGLDLESESDSESSSADVKEEDGAVEPDEETHVVVKRKREDTEPDDAETDSKEGVLSKRPRGSPTTSVDVKQEAEVKLEA